MFPLKQIFETYTLFFFGAILCDYTSFLPETLQTIHWPQWSLRFSKGKICELWSIQIIEALGWTSSIWKNEFTATCFQTPSRKTLGFGYRFLFGIYTKLPSISIGGLIHPEFTPKKCFWDPGLPKKSVGIKKSTKHLPTKISTRSIELTILPSLKLT